MNWAKPLLKSSAHKYKAKQAKEAGHAFASQGERECFRYLLNLEKLGEIKEIRCQDTVYLTKARIRMIPDFSAVETHTGERVYYEFKGFETTDYRIKRRLWMHYGPATLHVYKSNRGGLYLHESIKPKTSIATDGDETNTEDPPS